MKKIIGIFVVTLLSAWLYACSMFSSVDPLPPAISELTIVDVKRTEITVSGTIGNPDFENTRQEKKSGAILEYGLVYGNTADLDITKNAVLKLDSVPTVSPVVINNQRIGGLTANTDYYIAMYARNEGGGLAYSETVSIKTTSQPAMVVNAKSTSIERIGLLWYDLDEGRATNENDAKADVTLEWFSIVGRGTVLSIGMTNGAMSGNLGPVNFDNLTYLNLVNTSSALITAGYSFVFNANSANSVIVFKTGSGRFGKWRLESLSGNVLVSSLTTYEN